MISPAREVAYAVIRRVFEQDAWADRALDGELGRRRLDARDRGLARVLVYGTVQRVRTLDWVVEQYASRRLEPAVAAALRLGAYQLLYLDRVPAHAAVGESVELAKRDAPRASGLVNAVLRKVASGGLPPLGDETAAGAALKHSFPDWIAEMWWAQLGADGARALMAASNESAESAVRANTLRGTVEELRSRLPVESHVADGLPESLVMDGAFDPHSSELWAEGLFMPQSRAATFVGHCVAPEPGQRVLDLCAAPGGKTSHLAALMGDEGELVAVENHAGRAKSMEKTLRRMGVTCAAVKLADARERVPGLFDRVLVDPPCSDLGTLSSRPDARWRKDALDPDRLSGAQAAILRAGADAVRPGGLLVYSTCTISSVENEEVVTAFLAERADFEPEPFPSDLPVWEHPSVVDFRQSLPHRDGTDGFFVARLRRAR